MVGEVTEQQMNQRLSSKKKTIKMLMTVVIVFAVCWLPLNLYHIIKDFVTTDPIGYNTFLVCHWLAFSSVCWNPFIYFGLNQYYRQGLKNICLLRGLSKTSGTHSLATSTRSTTFLLRNNSRNNGFERKFHIFSFARNNRNNRSSGNSGNNTSLVMDNRSPNCRYQSPNGSIRNHNNNIYENTSF